jgi:hypothetical protein
MNEKTDPLVSLSIRLSDLNLILTALDVRPHGEVRGLIDRLHEQGVQALSPPPDKE